MISRVWYDSPSHLRKRAKSRCEHKNVWAVWHGTFKSLLRHLNPHPKKPFVSLGPLSSSLIITDQDKNEYPDSPSHAIMNNPRRLGQPLRQNMVSPIEERLSGAMAWWHVMICRGTTQQTCQTASGPLGPFTLMRQQHRALHPRRLEKGETRPLAKTLEASAYPVVTNQRLRVSACLPTLRRLCRASFA